MMMMTTTKKKWLNSESIFLNCTNLCIWANTFHTLKNHNQLCNVLRITNATQSENSKTLKPCNHLVNYAKCNAHAILPSLLHTYFVYGKLLKSKCIVIYGFYIITVQWDDVMIAHAHRSRFFFSSIFTLDIFHLVTVMWIARFCTTYEHGDGQSIIDMFVYFKCHSTHCRYSIQSILPFSVQRKSVWLNSLSSRVWENAFL